VLGKADRLSRLYEALEAVRGGRSHAAVNHVPQEAFAPLPYKVFGYWCSDAVREGFVSRRALSGERVTVRQAHRYRGRLPLAPPAVGGSSRRHPPGYSWLPFAKGGEYSPFHDDIHLLVSWGMPDL
jgi:hypothetical protein